LNRAADRCRLGQKAAIGRGQTTLRRCALTCLLLAALVAVGATHPAFAAKSLVHKSAPEFVVTDLNNQTLDLNAYRGKVVLLNFWATWCAPCQLEMPRFIAWQSQYGSRGLQIIGISMDDDPAQVRSFLEKLHLNYPVAMGDEKLGELYGGVLGLPLTLLIDSCGKVRAEYQGATRLTVIERQLKILLLHP
jgi:peroxiredoxin